ncbi:MAG: Jag N-terminal domain-containing protein [Clostridia bacterium]|nr:Jag N-terminal domain-containing protein [Clostridia bacterium]
MIKEARGFGEDITEAQENARKNLGVSADADVQFEIVSQSKKKVLGIFGGSKAEVRAFIELPDAPQKKVRAPKNANKAEKKSAKKTAEEPKVSEKAKKQNFDEQMPVLIDESEIDKNSKTYKAITYLKSIAKEFGCEEITVKAFEKENGAFISLDGKGLGAIIGRRGETLDALQYLAGLSANDFGGYFKVSLNIGDYREKREKALVALADKVAKQVLESGRSRALEPMNPYERRIIHTAVQEIDGVVSNSIGEGLGRRVVVYSENGDSKPPRFTNDRRRGQNPSGKRPSKNSNTVSSVPTREPKKDNDIPLYGKIN